ncbi:MAG: hypothetical protein WBV39_16240 [Rudaea sp.]
MNQARFSLRNLLAEEAADGLISPDLWPRIVAARTRRVRRRRNLRFVSAGSFVLVALCGVLAFALWRAPVQDAASTVDWQARAQALELQLDALPMPAHVEGDRALNTLSEIARVDADLQSAYDRGAARDAILALWKRRSELLAVLLAERRRQRASEDI